MLGILLQAVGGATKAIGEAAGRLDDTGGRSIIGMAAQAVHGFGERLGNIELTGSDVAGVGFSGGFMERMRGALSFGAGNEPAVAPVTEKLGRSAGIHMGLIHDSQPEVVAPVTPVQRVAQVGMSV